MFAFMSKRSLYIIAVHTGTCESIERGFRGMTARGKRSTAIALGRVPPPPIRTEQHGSVVLTSHVSNGFRARQLHQVGPAHSRALRLASRVTSVKTKKRKQKHPKTGRTPDIIESNLRIKRLASIIGIGIAHASVHWAKTA